MTFLPAKSRRNFLPLWLVLAACLCIHSTHAQTIAAPAVRRSTLHFSSGGRDIQIDLYEPAAASSAAADAAASASAPHRPDILVLHGAGGVIFDGPRMRRVAQRLAQGGSRAYLVHYFNRSGTLVITRDSIMYANFDRWLETVRDAVSFVQGRQPRPQRPARAIRPAPVGIYGYSLGAFLAVAAASDHPQIAAIAEQSGGVWKNEETRVRRMPPVLMIHGQKDTRVPFDKYALPLEKLLHKRGAKVETSFYPDESHVFRESAQKRVREKVAAFFARQFRQKPSKTFSSNY